MALASFIVRTSVFSGACVYVQACCAGYANRKAAGKLLQVLVVELRGVKTKQQRY